MGMCHLMLCTLFDSCFIVTKRASAVFQVSGVAFDPHWTPPSSDSTGENVMYRFGSVGQVQPSLPMIIS